MINIRLNEKYAILSDTHQFKLCEVNIAPTDRVINDKVVTKAGDEIYDAVGYYGSPRECLLAIPAKVVRSDDITTLKQLLERIVHYQDLIEKHLCGMMEGI